MPAPASLIPRLPLCVDLDGSLVMTDTLIELLLICIKKRDPRLLRLPAWLAKGRAFTKQRLALLRVLDPKLLPYNPDILKFLQAERRRGRTLVLATAADISIAQRVAGHLGIFDQVIASDGVHNLSGRAKGTKLKQLFGNKGFDYLGNEPRDAAVWRHAKHALVAGPFPAAIRAAKRVAIVTEVFPAAGRNAQAWLQALRPHQWIKNILIFAPLLLAHRLDNITQLTHTLLGFAAFCLSASAIYLINDLFDLPHDRQHPVKRFRPLPAGRLPLLPALLLAPALLLGSLALSSFLNPAFTIALLVYVIVATGYSWYLKEIALVDVFTLSVLYVIRVIAGARAAEVSISFWFLSFALFLFFTLAVLKRVSELNNNAAAKADAAPGRGYAVSDRPLLLNLAAVNGYLSVLVIALYIHSPDVSALYRSPTLLWLLVPIVFYWLSRLLFLASRGTLPEDPVLFASKDKLSYLSGLAIAIIMYFAA